jgi:hypothetical protein
MYQVTDDPQPACKFETLSFLLKLNHVDLVDNDL